MAMNGLSNMAATAFLLVLAIVPAAIADIYTVGGASQWDSGVDYIDWVKGKTFRVGDILEFKYGPSHSLDVVDKSGYDACDGSIASEIHSDGDTHIELKKIGTMYFICPTPGHCASGMKLAVTVVASSSSPPTSTSSPPSPPPTSAPSVPDAPPTAKEELPSSDGTYQAGWGSTTPPPPPPPPSNGASSGVMSYLMVGILLVLACNVWVK